MPPSLRLSISISAFVAATWQRKDEVFSSTTSAARNVSLPRFSKRSFEILWKTMESELKQPWNTKAVSKSRRLDFGSRIRRTVSLVLEEREESVTAETQTEGFYSDDFIGGDVAQVHVGTDQFDEICLAAFVRSFPDDLVCRDSGDDFVDQDNAILS